MRLYDLLKDKMMGIYVGVIKDNEEVKGVYEGMTGGKFVIKTLEDVKAGDEVTLRLAVGGWNFIFPCVVERIGRNGAVLKPVGKVKIREKRKEKRVPTLQKCVINDKRGLMLDVSFHGTRILALDEYNIGDIVEVKVRNNSIKGKVRWIKSEIVDLRSMGVLIEDSIIWWKEYVKERLAEALKVLRGI